VYQFILIGLASFVFIGLKAFQQLNVVHHQIKMVPLTSSLMAVMEVTVVLGTVKHGFWSCIPMAIGGSTGCILAMMIHKHFRKT
jgi:hypothetical protein